MLDPVVLAFDVTPDRSKAAIVASGRRLDGLAQIEVVEHRAGTAWLPARLAEIAERNHAIKVLCGASSPAESLVRDCWDFGVTVEVVDTTDHAIACSKFATLVDERAIRHLGGEDLRSSIKGAGRRPLNDAWLWSRKNSTVNIAPLVAATLASWAFVSSVSEGAFVY
jgi:DNA-binding transcriptional LysR family regulator